MANSYDSLRVDTIIGIGNETFSDIVAKEVILGESLLTPGLQTAVTINSWVYGNPIKVWSSYKNQPLTLSMVRPATGDNMEVSQKVYRIDNRELDINTGQTETLTLHACDQSLLNDAKNLVSKSWKCTQAADVVKYVLQSCAGVTGNIDIDQDDKGRDYIAENIHPFQVVAQQANMALKDGVPALPLGAARK